MNRPQAISVENKFIRGLITENSALAFPKDACTETWNCIFDYTGRVTRRKGFDLEQGYVTTNTYTPVTGQAWSSFVWRNVGGDATKSFFVQQIGPTIYFYNITDNTSVGTGIEATTINLLTYVPTGSTSIPDTFMCQYAQGRGNLVIVNEICEPLLVKYDIEGQAFTVSTISLQARDFEGVDDGLDLLTRPTASIAGIKTSNPSHYYNILNQGWATTDALTQWDAARSDLPSNADMVAYYRADTSNPFNNGRVDANEPGNSPAIKGHFILTVGENDRTQALIDEGFTGAIVPGANALIDRSTGTVIGDFTSNTALAFNGTTSANAAASATKSASSSAYIGKNWGTGVTKKVGRVLVYPATDNGFLHTYTGNVKIDVYGKASAPANATDGTLLGTLTTTGDVLTGQTIELTDVSTSYQYHWVTITAAPTPASYTTYVGELQFYQAVSSFARPRTVAFFAGRAWYAGIDSQDEAGKIFFTQIIRQDDDYGKCYQDNDPTSEQLADLLDNDGGVVRIPEIGKVERLFPFQAQLLVFASNGVWVIKGGTGGFKATDYSVRRITNIGTFSPLSVVDAKGIPVWWAEDGIYTASYDPNFDSTTVESLTEETIKTFYLNIPSLNRRYVKGTYDRLEDRVYWVYNDTASLPAADVHKYNRVLVFDGKTLAFYPWTIGNSGDNSPAVRDITYIQDGARADTDLLKFPISYTVSATNYRNFADVTNANYLDWETYASAITVDADDELDFDSYMISGYEIDAELLKFFQTNYVNVFLEQETNASLFMRGLWDFSNNASSGKWSTAQQCYNNLTTKGRTHREVNHRRLKVRGKGKAFQFRLYSETEKPFTILGWAAWKTSNGSL